MRNIKLHLGYAGFCEARENHALRDGKKRDIKFFALWGLILHPEEGYILFDTGYAMRFYHETRRFPNKIYALITKVTVHPEDEIIHQLSASGIDPKQIRKIFISHFHADHLCGLLDFPNARIITSRSALHYTLNLNRVSSFRKGVLKGLLPEDLESRVDFVEDCEIKDDPYFGKAYDLFGDASLMAYELPGHARGQLGLMLETAKQKYFLVADAVWLRRSFEKNILPSPVVRLFFDSWSDYKWSLRKIHEFHRTFPDVVIIPTHCEQTTSPLVSKLVQFEKL